MDSRILKKREELLGKEFTTKNYGKCFIIDYKGRRNVTVMFYDPIGITKCGIDNLNKGCVDNPNYHFKYPTVYGVGVRGEGKYNPSKDKRVYKIWTSVIQRCYDKSFKTNNPTYQYITMCREWLCFQNFAEWFYNQNFHDAKDSKGKFYDLDKDILVKGNKIYSPETCCFVPHDINCLFISCKKVRGDLPIGVTKHKKCNKYSMNFRNRVYVGGFDTPEEAFQAYKILKEDCIKTTAKSYFGKICNKAYEKLMVWEIRIDD